MPAPGLSSVSDITLLINPFNLYSFLTLLSIPCCALSKIHRLNINEALCRAALRLEALGEQQHWIGSLESQVRDLESELSALEARRDESVKQFGISPDSVDVAGGALSTRASSELRATSKSLHAVRQEIDALRAKAR